MKRLLALLLALSMVISLLPAMVLAEEMPQEDAALTEQLEEPEGDSEEDPEEDSQEDPEEEAEEDSQEEPEEAPEEDPQEDPQEEPEDELIGEEPVSEEAALEAGETSGTCGENLTWTFANGTLTISGTGAMDDYEYDFDQEKGTAPWSDLNVQTLVIEEGATSIGEDAFCNMATLTGELVLPSTLKTVEGRAFDGTGLTSVTLNEGLEKLKNAAFASCEGLTLQTGFPDSLQEIGGSAFFGCYALTGELIFGSKLTTLGLWAFAYTGITKVTLPNQLTAEGYAPRAFMGCESLTEILVSDKNEHFQSIDGVLYSADGKTLLSGPSGKTGTLTVPGGVETIKANAFYNGHITEVNLPATIKTVEEYAFAGSQVQTVIYAGSKEEKERITIGQDAFPKRATWYCTEKGTCGEKLTWNFANGTLTISGTGDMYDFEYDFDQKKGTAPWSDLNVKTLVLNEGVTSIGENAFCNMATLTGELVLPSTLKTVESRAFYGTSLTSVTLNDGLEKLKDAAFWGCKGLTLQTGFPDSLQEIGVSAFNDCYALTGELIFGSNLTTLDLWAFAYTGITKVTLPDQLTAEGYDPKAFIGCESLTEILVSDKNEHFQSIDGALYSADGKTLLSGPSGKTGTLTVPEGVVTIEDYAFYFGHITEVGLPTTIKAVKESAFEGSQLQTVIYAGTLKEKNEIIFGEAAFPVNAVWKYPNDRSCGENLTWAYDEETKTLTISGMVDYEYDYDRKKGTAPWESLDVQTLVLNEGLTSIGSYAFYEKSSLTGALVLPKSLHTINKHALGGTGLTSVTLNEGLTEIGYRAFGDSKALTLQGGFPESLEAIETYAFVNCGQITGEVSFGENLRKLGGQSFAETGITKVTLPDGLRADNYECTAFASCESLTEILVSDSHPDFQTVDGVLYSKDGTILYSGPAGKTGTLTVPEGVTTIKRSAFDDGHITAVSLPKSLQTVEEDAFYGASIRKVTYGGTQAEKEAIDIADGNDALRNATWKTADMPSAGEDWTYDEKTKTLTVSGTGDMDDYSAEASAPWQDKDVAKLIVQEGVTYIGSYAFAGLSVKTLSLPESLEAAGENAFANTPKAIQITYGGSAERWTYGLDTESWGLNAPKVTAKGKNVSGDLTWSYDAKTKTLTVSGSGQMADYDLENLPDWLAWGIPVHKLALPAGMTDIGEGAFRGLTYLQQVTLPKKLRYIGKEAFADSGLTGKLTIPDGVTIRPYAFRGTAITSLVLPADVDLFENAFAGCDQLTEITYGGNEKVLWDMLGDSVSKSVTVYAQMPNGGTVGSVYWALDKKGTLTLRGSNSMGILPDFDSYEETPWADLTVKKLVISDGVVHIGANAFAGCATLTGELTLPDVLLYIGENAFAGTGIKTLRINQDYPKEFLQIVTAQMELPLGYAENAFEGSKLTDVYYSFAEPCLREFLGGEHPLLSKKLHCAYPYGGWDFRLNEDVAVKWCIDSKGLLNIVDGNGGIPDYEPLEAPWSRYKVMAIELPKGLYYIGSNAFYGMADLKKLTLPDTVWYIGEQAFYGCIGVTGTLTIPEGVTEIGDRAFGNLPKITALTLPASLESLGEGAFEGCTGLKTITFAGSMAKLMELDYYGDLWYLGASITCQDSSKGKLKCGASWSLDSKGTMTIEGTGTLTLTSDEREMLNNLDVRKVVIKPGITEIGKDYNEGEPYENCGFEGLNITEVSLPEGLTKLCDNVFMGCEKLTKITLPASLRELGVWSLDNYYVKTITVAKGSKFLAVKDGVLYSKDMTRLLLVPNGIKKLTIPDSVTTVAEGALGNNTLTTLVLGAGIGLDSVEGAAGLAGLVSYNNVTSLTVSKKNTQLRASGNVLFAGATLVLYPYARPGTEYRVPEGTTAIAKNAFREDGRGFSFQYLTRLVLPGSLEKVEEGGISSNSLELVVLGKETAIEDGNICGHIWCPEDSKAAAFADKNEISWSSLTVETVTLHFDAAETGAAGMPKEMSVTAGNQVTIPKKAPTLKGYTFQGWQEKTNGFAWFTPIYQPGATLTLTENMTLVPLFRKNGIVQEGSCGPNTDARWTLDKKGTLTISGTGAAIIVLPENTDRLTVKKLVIEEGITRLDSGIFQYVTVKGQVTIPASMKQIGAGVFASQTGITGVSFASSVYARGLRIDSGAFYGCTGIKGAVTLPAQLTSLNQMAFEGCTGITALNTAATYTFGGYASVDGVLYQSQIDSRILLRCPEGKTGAITIPTNTISIADRAFQNSKITKVYYQNGEANWKKIEGRENLPVYPTFAYEIQYTSNVDSPSFAHMTMSHANPNSILASQTITLKNAAMDGYLFQGWYDADGKKVTKLAKGTSDTVTLTAHFTPITYTVAYNANGGKGKTPGTPCKFDEQLTIGENKFNRTGYTFVGWNTAKNGTGTWYEEGETPKDEVYEAPKNLTVKNKGTVTLYAQWQANDYVVIFDANGGEGNMEPQHFTYDSAQALTANAFTREGYTFTGWNTKPDGKGKTYKNLAKVKNLVTEDSITLYAQWKKAK